MAALLQRLLEVMREPAFEQARFDNIRRDMIRGLENSVAKRPTSQVIDDLRESLLYGEWGEQAMIAALQQISLADVEQYAAEFWQSATAESLLFGNYKPAEAADLADALAPMLASAEAPPRTRTMMVREPGSQPSTPHTRLSWRRMSAWG